MKFIQRLNQKKPFVEITVERIGYPRWDKMIKISKKLTVAAPKIASTTKTNTVNNSYESYYVPFVRDAQNYVNAAMMIHVSATDTSIGYLCDWEYQNKTHGSPMVDTTAERYALFFMTLDNRTLGHMGFNILNPNLFPSLVDSAGGRKLNLLNKNRQQPGVRLTDLVMGDCYDYYSCATPWFCGVYNDGCDYQNCSHGCKLIATLCWNTWIPSSGSGGTSWGSTDIGVGSGDGSGGGSGGTYDNPDIPLTPCEGPPAEAKFSGARTGLKAKVNSPCDATLGWVPVIPHIVADEIEPTASDNDPENIWWDDNTSDPNTNYQPQPKPRWGNMYLNYPKDSKGDDMPVAGVCALIGGNVLVKFNQGNINNACALRVSRALNYSGVIIPVINGQTVTGSDGKNYFLMASHLKNWLTKVFGTPDVHITAADVALARSSFKSMLIGIQNRGIYIMKPQSETNFQASGHATLWAGLDCIGMHNYFGAASDVFIWRLSQ